jgi:serine/threonine protein kinase
MATTQAAMSMSDFLTVLRKSALVEPAELTEYIGRLSNADQMTGQELAERLQADGLLTPFQVYHLLRNRYKNFFIGRYKVVAPLGHGGMSQVFLAEHSVMKHLVALKLLPIKDSADPGAIGRFLREARAAAAVNHPNVVRAHDIDKADGHIFYLVMDYVDGVNLHDLVKRIGPLAPEQAANYIAQAAIGLQEIASKGLIHRDLKPSNLLLDREGVIRILDLGLARFTNDTEDNLTKRFEGNTIFGTADYLAPEQALQMPNADARMDIYSLGATLHFLLSGRAPFEELSTTQKLLAHQFNDPQAIEDVPLDLQRVMMTMMRKKPEDRYQSAYDVVEALAPWASLPMPLPPDDFFPDRGLANANVGPMSNGPRSGAPSTKGFGKTAVTDAYGTGRFPSPTSDVLRASARARSSTNLAANAAPKSDRALLIAIVAIAVVGFVLAGLIAAGVFR